jgi:two-component system, chemotaxis family, response regulator Rcp1
MEVTDPRTIWIIADRPELSDLIETVLRGQSSQYQIKKLLSSTVIATIAKPALAEPLPDLMLLDLESFDSQGEYLLSLLKQNHRWRRIPIVVLSHSSSSIDVLKSYTLQGNAYVVKSWDTAALVEVVQQIESFWLKIVTLPSAS